MNLLSLTPLAEYGARKIYRIRPTRFEPRRCDGFVLYLRGACAYAYGYTHFVAQAGCFLYLPKGQPYSIHPVDPDSACLLIDFDGEFSLPRTAFCRRLENADEMERFFQTAIRAAARNDRARRALIFGMLYQIVAALEAPGAYAGEKRARLAPALARMHQDYLSRDLTVPQLAVACGVSEKYFQQLFQQVYHATPKEYLLSLRFRQAKRLLESTELPVGEIARQCGFSSLYYFSRAFKAANGVTPSEYRQSARAT